MSDGSTKLQRFDLESSVRERYASAAHAREAALCSSDTYDPHLSSAVSHNHVDVAPPFSCGDGPVRGKCR
jgi:hypothetical protein